MSELDDARNKAAATYNTASDYFDHPANTFCERFGRRTVERLQLARGARVLDVCCGSGASAIPAAEFVGPGGSVVGVDLAENLLELGTHQGETARPQERRVSFRRPDQPAFRSRKLRRCGLCVRHLLRTDMQAALLELKRVLRTDRTLAITTWGPRLFEPANTAFWNSVRDVRPDLHKGFNPWDRISEPNDLRSLFIAAGLTDSEIVAEAGSQPVNSAEDWWAMILGSGYRGTVEQLSAEDRERVRRANFEFIRQAPVRSVEANVVYGVALKKREEN